MADQYSQKGSDFIKPGLILECFTSEVHCFMEQIIKTIFIDREMDYLI